MGETKVGTEIESTIQTVSVGQAKKWYEGIACTEHKHALYPACTHVPAYGGEEERERERGTKARADGSKQNKNLAKTASDQPSQ